MSHEIQNPFEVAPGEKAVGWMPVSTTPGGAPISLPWMVVRGAHDGPVLTVDSGIHGDEYEGPEAILRTWQSLDPSELRGTFVGVPIVNVPAYDAASRLSPIDHLNLNRLFPGTGAPTISQLIARTFFEEIVLKSDAVLDLHGGGSYISLVPIVMYANGPSENEQRARALAEATGFEFLWGMTMGSSGGLAGTSTHAGIPALTVEAGNAARLTEADVLKHAEGISNVMVSMKMLDGEMVMPPIQRHVKGKFLPSPAAGFFKAKVALGDEVTEGQVIAEICDLFGEVKAEVRAPNPGYVCIIRSLPTVLHGEEAVFVGELVSETKS